MSGEWQPGCTSPGSNFVTNGNELVLDLFVFGACVLGLKLDMVPTAATGEIQLYFRSKEYLYCPLGTEEYSKYTFYPENISQEISVGKLIPINQEKVQFSWNGLFDKTTKERLFLDNLPFEDLTDNMIVLNFCEEVAEF